MSTAVTLDAMAKADSQATTEQTVAHGGRTYTTRPESRNGAAGGVGGMSIFTILWIVGAIMWSMSSPDVSHAGKIMFWVGITPTIAGAAILCCWGCVQLAK